VTNIDHGRAVTDPVEFITELVMAVDDRLAPGEIPAIVSTIAGGRAKSRRLAAFLADHSAVLRDGRSPAPRAIGDLLIALRSAGASVSAPVCAECEKQLRTLQRVGQGWYCGSCSLRPVACAACGQQRRVATRDRAGAPRCAQCPDRDERDPISVIYDVIAQLDPAADRDVIVTAVRKLASRPTHQRKIVDRRASRRGYRRHRAAGVSAVSSRCHDRQAARWAASLPHLHRAYPHPGMRTLGRASRTSHPRPQRPAIVSELLDHRPRQPRSLPQLRSTTPGQPPNTGRADLRMLPAPADHDLLELR
jgi:hypothetical protein